MTLREFLDRLDGVHGSGGQYVAKCPAHNDSKPSLSVGLGDDGRVLVKCQTGCSTEKVVGSMGLTMRDLFEVKPGDVFPSYAKAKKGNSPVVATYDYKDASGKLLAQKLRMADKSFTWRQPDPRHGWIYKRTGVPNVLYNLPVVATVGSLWVVEGEKDVDTLTGQNQPAVCGADGAGPGKWRKEYTEALRGKKVVVVQDNDPVGKDYAAETANALHGVAESVKVLDLSTIWPEIPEHGDTTDLVEHMGAREAIAAMYLKAVELGEWEPVAERGKESPSKPVLIRASDVPYEQPKWTIKPYFQRGKGTLIQGDNGSGKTAFMCAIAAHITTGEPLLGLPIATPGNVLMLSVEDDLPVLRGRVEASGGDVHKCVFMANAAGMTFNSPEVEAAIVETNAKMVIFDPFQAFLGAKVDMFRSNETRPELAKLFEMCERHDCSCAIIAHMGKSGGDKSPVNRSLGSVDIPAAMRSILQLTRNPDNEDECVMVHVKCSNAPKGQSIAYTIGERGGVHWTGFSPMTSDDLTAIVKRKEKGIPYDKEPLVQVFNQMVTDKPGGGFWSYEDVKRIGQKLLGFPPFYSTADLKAKLNSAFCRELQERDGLIVTCGYKSNGCRGIRIDQYQVPQGYQTRIDNEDRDASPCTK